MLTDELLTSIFDGQPHVLATPMATWLVSSRRFTAFVSAHHTKIRKKLRTTQNPESLRDLQLELETAYLLLREKSLNVAYETHYSQDGRSPDFTVTFTTSHQFMVEVTRMRTLQLRTLPEMQSSSLSVSLSSIDDRFTDMLCSKLGQLLPQRSNVLLVSVEFPQLTPADLNAAMLSIQQRAESNDPSIVGRHGFHDRADFFRHYQRLSAILLRGGTPLQAGESVIVWDNPQAKHPLPAKVRTALSRSHTL